MLGVLVDGTQQSKREAMTFCPIIYPLVPPHTALKLLCFSQLKRPAEHGAGCHFFAHLDPCDILALSLGEMAVGGNLRPGSVPP